MGCEYVIYDEHEKTVVASEKPALEGNTLYVGSANDATNLVDFYRHGHQVGYIEGHLHCLDLLSDMIHRTVAENRGTLNPNEIIDMMKAIAMGLADTMQQLKH